MSTAAAAKTPLPASDREQNEPVFYIKPMRTCVPGRNVLLLNPGAVLISGAWDGHDKQFLGWSPLPVMPPGGLAALV
jgi:hypothetical protein